MDYFLTIFCAACGAIRSFERQADDTQLADADILAKAAHSHGCPRLQAGNGGAVSMNASTPANVLYSIS